MLCPGGRCVCTPHSFHVHILPLHTPNVRLALVYPAPPNSPSLLCAAGATMDAVDRIPLIKQFLEFVGLAVTSVYAYRYFTDPSER